MSVSTATVSFEPVSSASQIRRVARLARDIWEQHFTPIVGAAQVQYMLDTLQSAGPVTGQIARGYAYDLVLVDATDAGYLAVVADTTGARMQLSKLYLTASLRGHGIGRQMLQRARHRCREAGCRKLWLTVNRHNNGSIAAYEAMGFRTTRTLVTDIGNGFVMDDYVMELDINEGAASA